MSLEPKLRLEDDMVEQLLARIEKMNVDEMERSVSAYRRLLWLDTGLT